MTTSTHDQYARQGEPVIKPTFEQLVRDIAGPDRRVLVTMEIGRGGIFIVGAHERGILGLRQLAEANSPDLGTALAAVAAKLETTDGV